MYYASMHGAHFLAQGTWLLSSRSWLPLLLVTFFFFSVSKLPVSRWEGLGLPSQPSPWPPFLQQGVYSWF